MCRRDRKGAVGHARSQGAPGVVKQSVVAGNIQTAGSGFNASQSAGHSVAGSVTGTCCANATVVASIRLAIVNTTYTFFMIVTSSWLF